MTALVMLFVLAGAPADEGARESEFSEVRIEKPFDRYLLASPLLMDVSGAKVLRLPDGNRIVLAVASTVLKGGSAEERLRAQKVCRIKALASVVAERQGIQVAHVERLEERTVVVIEDGKETARSVSEFLQVTRTKVEGLCRDMRVVGTWRSKSGTVFYLAIGAVVDKEGEPVEPADPVESKSK